MRDLEPRVPPRPPRQGPRFTHLHRKATGPPRPPSHRKPRLHLRAQGPIQRRLLTAGPRIVTAPQRYQTTQSGISSWHSRRMDEAGSDQEHEPVQEEAKDDDSTIVPSPGFSPSGVPQTLWKPSKRSREQIRSPFLDSVRSITTSWLPSMRGFHVVLARRRWIRFGRPVTNWQRL